jgi:site-specific DNA-cytosine methylase
MKILSLFDGISCARVALERAGIPVEAYYASEIDEKAIQVSLKNYPDIIHVGDITKLSVSNPINWNCDNGENWESVFKDIDLICGGSPCQSFSLAGNKKGFDGKSGLFWEFARLVKTLQPKYFLLENVKMKQEWQDVISNELGVKPIEINSSLVSGQNRKRLYWTNIPNVTQPTNKEIMLNSVLEKEVDERYYLTESNIKNINRKFGSKGKILKSSETKSPTLVAAMGMGGGNVPVLTQNGRMRKLTEVECERLQTLPDNYTQGINSGARYKAIGNGWTVDVIAHILSFNAPSARITRSTRWN